MLKRTWHVSTARCSRSVSVCLVWPRCSPQSPRRLPGRVRRLHRGAGARRRRVRIAEAADHPIAVSWRPGRWAFGRCARATSARPSLCSNGLSISRKGLPPASRPLCRRALGAAYALAGRTANALPLLAQAVAQAVAMHYMWDHAPRMVWLSEAYLLAGRLNEVAGTQARRALEFSGRIRNGGLTAYAMRLLARSRRSACCQRWKRPKLTTARRSPWPRNWACARSRPTATAVSASLYSRVGQAQQVPVSPWARPLRCTGLGGDDLLAAPG